MTLRDQPADTADTPTSSGLTAPTFAELIEANPADTPQQTARLIEERLGLTLWQRAVLHPLLTAEVRRRRRDRVRHLEHERPARATTRTVTAPIVEPDAPNTTTSPSTQPTQRAAYLAEHFYNGTVYVLWGAATIADHEGRIAYMMKHRDGTDRTIAAHREAIQAIKETPQATCLNDVYDVNGDTGRPPAPLDPLK